MYLRQIISILTLALFFTQTVAQKANYRDIRYSLYLLPCGAPDSFTVWTSIYKLQNYDTTKISKHLNEYYDDLGTCYWLVSGGKDSTLYWNLALAANRASLFHKPDDTKALWNCSITSFRSGDCKNGKYYMALYKKYTPKKYQDAESLKTEKNLLAQCE